MTEVDAFLTTCRLADGRLVDIGIAGGKIAAVGEGAAASSNSAPELDIAGDLVLPGLVDGHMHLDKTLTGLPWDGARGGPDPDEPHRDRQDNPPAPADIDRRASWKPDPRMRRARDDTHVDIDLQSGLAKLEGVLAARERYRDRVTAKRRFPPERCHALPRRSRPARCGGPQRRRSGRRHRSAGNRP
jgi:cytosine/creatinine deaminase